MYAHNSPKPIIYLVLTLQQMHIEPQRLAENYSTTPIDVMSLNLNLNLKATEHKYPLDFPLEKSHHGYCFLLTSTLSCSTVSSLLLHHSPADTCNHYQNIALYLLILVSHFSRACGSWICC